MLMLKLLLFAVATEAKIVDDALADLCQNVKGLNRDSIVAVDPRSQLVLNLCGLACGNSSLCLTDIHRKPIIEFSQPTVHYDNERFTYFLNYASFENTRSSDGFPFVAQIRLICEEQESSGGEDTNPRKFNAGELGSPGELDVKSPLYQLTWRSNAFCINVQNQRTTRSYGTFLIWIFLCSLVFYLSAMTAFNYFGRGKRGPEALPHFEFFSEVGKTVREFYDNLKRRLSEPYGESDYIRVSQSDSSVPGGFV